MVKKYFAYPFYQSLRFRFGLLFGLLFLVSLLVIVVILYTRLKKSLETSFDKQLTNQARTIAQKVEISPMVVPLPELHEVFLVTYNNKIKTDTLFNNLPFRWFPISGKSVDIGDWRAIQVSRALETGGSIIIVYANLNKDLTDDLYHLQLILFIFIPASLIISIIAGYFFSDVLLRPINSIIKKAGQVQLHGNIELLDEPSTKDELHQLAITLNRMLERIKKQSDQQNAFFASASHELRTPLSIMYTELQVLLSTALPEETRSILQHQLTEVQRINKIVNDFLWMSQLKSGLIILKQEKTDLVEMIMNNVERMKGKSEQKQQKFKIDLQPTDGEFTILADAAQLSVVLYNLLENAVKYGRPGNTINIILHQSATYIAFSINNYTDVVITNINELKNEFRQQDFHKDGFGLGLWIVDQLTEKNKSSLLLSFNNQLFTAKVIFPIT